MTLPVIEVQSLGIKAIATVALVVAFCSCTPGKPGAKDPLFSMMTAGETGITFNNRLVYSEELNTYTYRNFYNGAGVGIADFNLDSLPDIYFCGNQTDNKLYLNQGNFRFEDITNQAGVACSGVWCTGVSIADVNGDGYPDIYVCKSGVPGGPNRHNELFINNGDLTFSEQSEKYGLAVTGLSTHASFFDYDRDGDLDCYLLNNSFQSVTEFDIQPGQREIRDSLGANMLFRNDGGRFSNVSAEAGIYGSKIGFGLGVSVGDLNRDGWPDIYVANDFFERDYLYLNNADGTFSEKLTEMMAEISLGAMGADIGDINNDAWPDIFATEMTPEDNERRKTKAVFDDWDRYSMKVERGYHNQFARNVLQLNNQNGTFSEIGRYSGVSATDWSWGALVVDLDNDGWKDLFVANGIYKDLLDRDFLDFYSNPSMMRRMIQTEEQAILKVIDRIPSVKVPNYAFQNNGNLTFTNQAKKWGLGEPSFSNGAAYGDLDNDGDPDMVVNNVNMPAFVFRNESSSQPGHNFISIHLTGTDKNTAAIGSSATVYAGSLVVSQELFPARGFKSSVDPRLLFGLGNTRVIDSLIVKWPDGRNTLIRDLQPNRFLSLHQKDALPAGNRGEPEKPTPLFTMHEKPPGLSFRHIENDFNDFSRDPLLFRMLSDEGPEMAAGDVNGDGLEDLFICGAKDSPGSLYIQQVSGGFIKTKQPAIEADRVSEDTGCAFFDADGDGDADLYVASGGNEFPTSSSALADRLYLNNGKGTFSRSHQMLPASKYESTSCVRPADYDGDGDTDLFVGTRMEPFAYGIPVNGYLLANDGKGNFSNVSSAKAPALNKIGMITDMVWTDVDGDHDPDMVIVGDWMPVRLLLNQGGKFEEVSQLWGLADTEGWYQTVAAADLNGDGHMDLVLGNHGLNSLFRASTSKPVYMHVNDFDLNGSVEQIICTYSGGVSYPLAMKDDLVRQIPSLANRYPTYSDYAGQTLENIFPPEVLSRSIVLKSKRMESTVCMNSGRNTFVLQSLPAEAQLFPIYAIVADDFNGDGVCDLLLAGNQLRAKPETGIWASAQGLLLQGTPSGNYLPLPPNWSGIRMEGAVRDMEIIRIKNKPYLVVGRNNDYLQFYTFQPAK